MSSSIVLVCAVLASLAAGVLLAYGVCQVVFAMFSNYARRVEGTRSSTVITAAPAIES